MTCCIRCTACVLAAGALLFATSGAANATHRLIGFDFTTAADANPSPQNWNRVSAPDGTIFNAIDETGATTNVNFNYGGGATGGFVYLSTATLAPNATPQYDYSLSGMTGYGFRTNGEFFINITGLKANDPYEFWFVAYRGSTNIDNLIRVSNGDVIDAFNVSQQITSTANDGRFIVNSTIADNTMHWNDLSMITNASSTGEITFNWSPQSQTPVIGAIAIRWVPAPGSVALLAMGGLVAMRRRR
ncbi:MAG: PEP-CTERM sorting domain-containing protein [Phycisphaerales bacterium]|nr:MAG: PEP-CTERM sorting domain-containing protein [Phycisphaerales bacterium]